MVTDHKKRKEMEKRVLKLLYRSLDSGLKKKDQERLDKALAESKELRKHRAEILSLRQALAQGAARSFRPQFDERVMNRVRSVPKVSRGHEVLVDSYRWVFKRLAAVSLLILMVLISVAVIQDGLFPQDAIFYISDTAVSRILQLPVF
jgi:anti-sigma factor RsiW